MKHPDEPTRPQRSVSRRTFLYLTALGAGSALLAACGAAPAGETTASSAASVAPASQAAASTARASQAAASTAAASQAASVAAGASSATGAGVEGKLASPMEGVPDAYTKLPTLTKTVSTPPGTGGTVRSLTIAYNPPPTAKDDNQYWQELDKRLGVTWEPTIVPQPTYGEKTAATIASGDLGDLFYLNPGQNAPHLYKAMDQGAFLDLTPYLTGDALNEFPNLATFPDVVWSNVTFKGKIFGVPKPIQLNGNLPFYRADWAEALGIEMPKNAEEVKALLVGFSKNDPDGNGQPDTWGMGAFGDWSNQLVFPMFNVPYNWRLNDDGTLTHQIETPEFKQALEYLRGLWDAGAYHPDSPAMNFTQAQDAFKAGKTGLHMEGFGSFFGNGLETLVKATTPTADLAGLVQPGHDGGQGLTYNTIGFFGFTAIPVTAGADEAKIKELLHVLDYLASPFGTEEQFFLVNGLEGTHHTVTDGVPARTDQGKADIGDLVYTMGPLPVFFYPTVAEHAEEAQRLAQQAMQQGINDPTWGLYSPTNVAQGSELNQLSRDRVGNLVTGREPLTGLDDYIAQWRSRGGDQVRTEYQQAVQERGT